MARLRLAHHPQVLHRPAGHKLPPSRSGPSSTLSGTDHHFRHPTVRLGSRLFASNRYSSAGWDGCDGCDCLCGGTTSLLSAAKPSRLYTAASILRMGILAIMTFVMAPSG